MGRREDREALQSTWHVYEPRKPGTPFRKKDFEAAHRRASAEALPPGPNVTDITQAERHGGTRP